MSVVSDNFLETRLKAIRERRDFVSILPEKEVH